MSIAVFGVNHRTAPLEVRERFAHAAREVPGSLGRVLAAGARGGVLLSTCNRTEFYLTEPGDTVPEIVWTLDQPLGERSEEHTSELQSHSDLVCRLLLEKKKKYTSPVNRVPERGTR